MYLDFEQFFQRCYHHPFLLIDLETLDNRSFRIHSYNHKINIFHTQTNTKNT